MQFWLDLRHSIRFRLFMTMFLFMVAIYYWMQNNVSTVLSDVAIEHTRTSIRLTSEALNLAITPHTNITGLKGLSDYFHELLAYDGAGLVYLALYDDSGSVLVSAGLEQVDLTDRDAPFSVQVQHGIVHVVQPMLILKNQVGELRFGLSTRAFNDSVQRIHNDNLIIMLGSISLFGFVLLLSSVGLNRRLMRLMRAGHALASGDYSVRAPETGKDELSLLAASFNVMATAVQSRMQALASSQESVHQLNAQLEQRVAARTWELESALNALKETQHSLIQSEKLAGLGALVAGVSHELNTPVGNALMVVTTCADKNKVFYQLLQEGKLRKSDLEEYVAAMQEAEALASRNLRKAADLIHGFKQVAIDQTSYQRRRFNLLSTVQEILLTIQPMLRHGQIEIQVQIPDSIVVDSFPGPLGQIITNLVGNAVVHAFDEGESGKVTLSAIVLDHAWLVLTVSDNGKGIAVGHLNKVFDPFFTTRLGKGGSGLGLHIVHNLVTGILGGNINVYSNQGTGTDFILKIPLVAPLLVATQPTA